MARRLASCIEIDTLFLSFIRVLLLVMGVVVVWFEVTGLYYILDSVKHCLINDGIEYIILHLCSLYLCSLHLCCSLLSV